MEVHAHTHTAADPDSHRGRKKWTHYFWEFLMLFLAVFCGFLAEYQLEHKIEKTREKQYIKSFIEDLEADTVDIEKRMAVCELTANTADSLIILLSRPDKDKWANDIYYFFRLIHRSTLFSVNDRTIIQLRNAGGMRLVTKKSISDSMVSYYKEVDIFRFLYEEQIDIKRSLRPLFHHILDGIDFGKVIDENNTVVRTNEFLKLKPSDPAIVNTYILILQNIKGINMGIKQRLKRLKEKAKIIRIFTQKEYHLK